MTARPEPKKRKVEVALKVIAGTDTPLVAMLDGWAAVATADQGVKECRGRLDRVRATGAPKHEVNYGVFVDGQFVGGIHTSGEHLNVMWIHWDHTQKGVGSRAVFAVLSTQIKKYKTAIVNQPNKKMCKALVKIMSPRRGSGVICKDGIDRMTLVPGDLRRPSPP